MQILDLLAPPNLAMAARQRLGYASLSPGWLDVNRLRATPMDPLRDAGERSRSVNGLSFSQLTASNLQMLLRYEDRNSMAHSVEARLPFLDYRLVEKVLGMPSEFKISDGWTKRLLREGMRGVLPEAIRVRRDKLGFATAEQEWATGPLKGEFYQGVKETMHIMEGILKPEALQITESMISGRMPFSSLPWRIICFGAWVKRHEVALN
jgi:asparagine synthase (glutamine-hydrolysing)